RIRDAGIGYLAYSPLGLGILTGAINEETEFHPQDFRGGPGNSRPQQFRPDKMRRILQKVERLGAMAKGRNTSPATLALRWVVEQGGVTAAIAGSRSPNHVRSNAEAGDLDLDEAALSEIDSIFS
ncbi:MAG TPA: aldo/keto reductase, partial [Actinomycetota bacterium]